MALGRVMRALSIAVLAALAAILSPPANSVAAARPPAHRHFKTAIYIAVGDVKELADRATFDREFARASSQLRFDKVWIEVYRDRVFATDAELERVKRWFREKGIETSGGITLAAGGEGGQFGTFDYEKPEDRAEAERAVRLAARQFDEVILDDFFFYTSKSDADIAAKGSRSWTQYRLDKMREVSRDLVLGPAKQVNPRVRVIIKYPNWYEHFHGLGYDLDAAADRCSTRSTAAPKPATRSSPTNCSSNMRATGIYRYLSNIRPDGGNLGGWVDTFSTRSVDRYAEQLWDTLFAKAPEITLFNWHPDVGGKAARSGNAAMGGPRTSFDWNAIAAAHPGAGWGTAANSALQIADSVLGELGRPVGVASYRPPHATRRGFPPQLHRQSRRPDRAISELPDQRRHHPADPRCRGRSADHRQDRGTAASGSKGHRHLRLPEGDAGQGFDHLAEWEATGHTIAIDQYFDGYGAGNGVPLSEDGKPNRPVLFPEVRFYTNDSWGIIRGVAAAKGFPMVLMNRYSKGTLYLWAIPENFGDLYNLPRPMLTRIKDYLFADAPVRLDAPPQVALFTYDNGAFIVENYRDEPASVTISVAGTPSALNEITQQVRVAPQPARSVSDNFSHRLTQRARRDFTIDIPPHSFRLFRPQN